MHLTHIITLHRANNAMRNMILNNSLFHVSTKILIAIIEAAMPLRQ